MHWSGNVRELRNVIERLIILSDSQITLQDVQSYVSPSGKSTSPTDLFEQFTTLEDYCDHTEKMYLLHKLEKNAWNISKTAEDIDIQRSRLYNKIEKYGLRREESNE